MELIEYIEGALERIETRDKVKVIEIGRYQTVAHGELPKIVLEIPDNSVKFEDDNVTVFVCKDSNNDIKIIVILWSDALNPDRVFVYSLFS